MEDFEDMEAIDLIDRIDQLVRRPKTYKIRTDPFELRDVELKKKYRFDKTTVRIIVDLIKEDIMMDNRGKGTSPTLQILLALRCWGRRQVQDDAGDIHGLSQVTVCLICKRVAFALAAHSSTFIIMPVNIAEEERIQQGFRRIKNFPSIIGAIDCTHVRIKKTGGDHAQYYINRKGHYSLNVQAVCDDRLKIRDVVARWRGSTHDSRIFNESTLKERLVGREFRGRLLGDSVYSLQPYLFTPILRPRNRKEIRYNEAHKSTRNTVERCFGVWKQRFRCLLHGMTVKLVNVKVLIVALAVLHNIAIDMNDPVPENADSDSEESEDEDMENEANVVNGEGNVAVPNIPAPNIPAPNIPAPNIPAPNIPAPNIPAPNIQRERQNMTFLRRFIDTHF